MPSFWKSPKSEVMKRAIIGKAWGTEVETYLWYDIGRLELTHSDLISLALECFTEKEVDPESITTFSFSCSEQKLIRLKGKLWLLPALRIRGRYCALYQMGAEGDPDFGTEKVVNFFDLKKPPYPLAFRLVLLLLLGAILVAVFRQMVGY